MPDTPDYQDYEERYRQMLEMQARQMALQWGAQRAGSKLNYSLNVPLTDPYGRLNYLRNVFPRFFMARMQEETPSIKDLIRLEQGNRWLDLQANRPDIFQPM